MSSISVSVAKSVSPEKLKEFFSFSGTVQSVESAGEGLYKVKFASPEAVSSALLLNGAELEGAPIKIEGGSDALVFTSSIAPTSSTIAAAAGVPIEPVQPAYVEHKEADAPLADIAQEHKPKSAIVAEYLAQGYALSDKAIDKAIELDKQHGILTKFKSFLAGLDSKYHVQDKAVETNAKYGLDKKFLQGRSDLSSYFNKAIQSPTGSKIHSFYTSIVSDGKEIHNEARRLADLKKEKEAKTSETAQKQ